MTLSTLNGRLPYLGGMVMFSDSAGDDDDHDRQKYGSPNYAKAQNFMIFHAVSEILTGGIVTDYTL